MSTRVAIVGTGYIADFHVRGVVAAPGAEFAGAVGSEATKARAFARKYGTTQVWLDVASLAADADVHAVVLATPNALHRPHAEMLLAAGKHVLIDKPMALNAAEAESMARVARDADRNLMIGHMWRFDREAQWLRDRVAEGALGEIVKTKGYGIHVNWGPSGWFTDRARSGGGALIDMGVHAIDTVRFLLGDPKPTKVYAHLRSVYGDYDVDDLGVLIIHWEGGPVSMVECGWWNPHADGPEAATQLFGTKGYGRVYETEMAFWEGQERRVVRPDLPERETLLEQAMYTEQICEFVNSIGEGRPCQAGPEVGLTVMRICDAAYASAKTGEVIAL